MNKADAEAQAKLLTWRWPELTTQISGGPKRFAVDIILPARFGKRRLQIFGEAERVGIFDMCGALFGLPYERPACEISQEEAEMLDSIYSGVEA